MCALCHVDFILPDLIAPIILNLVCLNVLLLLVIVFLPCLRVCTIAVLVATVTKYNDGEVCYPIT
jgi:hypothetical protein